MSNIKFYAKGVELNFVKTSDGNSKGWQGSINYISEDNLVQGDLTSEIFVDVRLVLEALIKSANSLGIAFLESAAKSPDNVMQDAEDEDYWASSHC